ncbi:MAG: regulatory protein RecX [Thermodesulfobacteriota bacterium]|nr:regulatory protein RecX [Thermodesulfobacteriota bacterium]
MDEDPLYEKARQKALRYLLYRARSIKEVQTRLSEKGFDDAIIKKVVDRFTDLGYLNDSNFARQWARRLAVSRQWGDKKIEASLFEKGISRDLIKKAIDEAREEKDERCAIEELVEKRLRRESESEVFSYKGRRRVTQGLVGRGFPVVLILDVLKEMGADYCEP